MPAVERVKLRMKIGVHELEAEGPRDLVMAQLEVWTRLAGLPTAAEGARGGASGKPGADPALRGLFAVDAQRRRITLSAEMVGRRRNADAALLLLYGFQNLLGDSGPAEVPAAALHAALAASGHRLRRPDRALTRYVAAGLIRKAGRHRHETYAVTAAGAQHAVALVRYLNSGVNARTTP